MNEMTVAASVPFGRDAAGYDAARRRLIPCFDDFYGTALRLVREWRTGGDIAVLDLGAGTGLFSAMLLAQEPVGRLCLLDGSAAMLEQARARFPADKRVTCRVADMAGADPGTGWDLVISALAIHHLSDAEKQGLYRRIRGALRPGGLFVNAEQVSGPTAGTDALYARLWLDQIRARGASEDEITRAQERMAYDRCAPVGDQLRWLAEAGFTEVDCSFKAWRFAVFSGVA